MILQATVTFLSSQEQLELKTVFMDKAVDCDDSVVPANTIQACGPPAKKQKGILDCLLGDND